MKILFDNTFVFFYTLYYSININLFVIIYNTHLYKLILSKDILYLIFPPLVNDFLKIIYYLFTT